MLTIRHDLGTVLIFGAGLIGRRIGAALVRRGGAVSELATPWHDVDALRIQLAALASKLEASPPARLDIVWSAGRAGFASDEAETATEEQGFRCVLDLAARTSCSTHVRCHLVSSAGGLFEGQRHVDAGSVPAPRRPYGRLKLRQERVLEALDATVRKRVYRLSSVYGPALPGSRRGLVATLLADAVEGRMTRIVGQLDTLRDYVWTEDVARRLADACRSAPDESLAGPRAGLTVETLASGKPTTIHEIVRHVRRIARRSPQLSFAARRSNASDITFAPSILPPAWPTTDLETAIHQLHRGVFAV